MLVGAALLFWGWQTGMLPVAVVLTCVLEGSRLTKVRWEFSKTDLNRIWNLCAFFFLGALAIAFLSNDGLALLDNSPQANSPAARAQTLNKAAKSFFLFVQWLPLAFFPITVAQAYGRGNGISLATFSWLLRRQIARQPLLDPGEINVSVPYFAVCMIAATTSTEHAESFYIGLLALLVWALWMYRVRRYAPAVVGLVLLLACLGGYAGNYGIRELQRMAMALDSALLSHFTGRGFNPREHQSLLGAVGRLKASSKIVLWVRTDGRPPPPLLREASYDQFTSPVWHSSDREFKNTLSENDQTTWKLVSTQAEHSLTISRLLSGGRGLLAFPNGITELRHLPVFGLLTNTLGALKSDSGPGYLSYRAYYGQGGGLDGSPKEEDWKVSPRELPAISRVAGELNLRSLADEDPLKVIKAVETYFQRNFSYSTYLDVPRNRRATNTAVARFLLTDRKGHCEYFAAATVLLLRQAGIPARYAVGYSIQEGGRGKYVVRDRHAHAWCLAHLNGTWVDVDTTPPSWRTIEALRAPWWQPLSDLWTNFVRQFSRLRWSGVNYRKYLLGALAPAAGALGILIYRRRQWTRAGKVKPGEPATCPGLDSEFYLVENRLRELGFDRSTGEALGAWLMRINDSAPRDGVPLEELLRLHYRYRFDPVGLGSNDRETLRKKSRAWLEGVSTGRHADPS
jgi:transglutaminase-like putative cysteine protease